jgi:hypothetical protein
LSYATLKQKRVPITVLRCNSIIQQYKAVNKFDKTEKTKNIKPGQRTDRQEQKQ